MIGTPATLHGLTHGVGGGTKPDTIVRSKPDFGSRTQFGLAGPRSIASTPGAPAQDKALRKRNLSGAGSPSVEWFSQRLQVS